MKNLAVHESWVEIWDHQNMLNIKTKDPSVCFSVTPSPQFNTLTHQVLSKKKQQQKTKQKKNHNISSITKTKNIELESNVKTSPTHLPMRKHHTNKCSFYSVR